MQLIFVRSNRPGSLAISASTWSAWSHVAVVDGDQVIEATASHGVIRRSRASLLSAFPRHLVVDVPTLDDRAGLAWARTQIGKPYDDSALIGFLMPWRRWDEADKWFCSELAAAALVAAGWPVPEQPYRVTPGMLRDWTRPAA